jgi:uncharacterized repeat protein (TIGR03803 family)
MSKRLFWYFLSFFFVCVTSIALTTSSAPAAAASDYKMLYSFQGEDEINDDDDDGSNGATGLIFDAMGNAYGTTVTGGLDNCGTVFQLKRLPHGQWQEVVLYSFTCFNDGKNPHGGVTFDKAGNLVGTTVAGGSGPICTGDGCGVVFEVTPSGEKVLYNFTGGNDGFGPGAPLTVDPAGNIFGETPDGGQYTSGTVFEMKLKNGNWQFNTIHAFTGGNGGSIGSLGPLLLDATGKLYGVTELGGRHSAGIAFRLAKGHNGAWNFSTLWTFKGQPDAGYPYGGLIPDATGNLYGTTYYGGANGVGSVYELSPGQSGWTERVLYSFKGGTDGSLPTTTLFFDKANNLMGTTSTGGRPSCDCGTIFKLKANTWAESIVHYFGVLPDGSYPYYNLVPGPGGGLYGATTYGGIDGFGAIFELAP